MNWTSTKIHMWQVDCHEFAKTGRPFELRDVTTAEHEEFAAVFSSKHNFTFQKHGTTITFFPKAQF